MKSLTFAIVITILLTSCIEDINVSVPIPDFKSDALFIETSPLSPDSKLKLNGIYKIESGNEAFGEYAVLKWCNNKLSAFFGKNMAFMLLDAGHIDSLLIVEGIWRFASDQSIGLVRLIVKRDEGGRSILEGNTNGNIILRGGYGSEGSLPSNNLVLKYERPLKESDIGLIVLAHRAGGRNSDRLPVSENTVEMAKYSEYLGVSGIEIDVRLTKDNIPVIFHDKRFSSRTMINDIALGEISNLTLKQLNIFCELKNGEKIPTLREMLDTVLYSTNHRYVWLDLKVPNLIEKIAGLQQEYHSKAKQIGSDLTILIGIPDDETKKEFLSFVNRDKLTTLCEISSGDAVECNSMVWGPRWTLGTMTESVQNFQKQGGKVFVWTLDEPQYVRKFIKEGKFNGILTNYPALVAFEYYMNQH